MSKNMQILNAKNNAPVTFTRYLREHGNITLNTWQRNTANMLLAAMYPWREGKTGKTFLMKHLSDFVNEHGNDYELERYCKGD
jgi:hypothetical protein